MPKRWTITVATGLTIGVLGLGLGWVLLEVGYYQGKIYGELEANTDTYARSAADDIERLCLRLEPSSMTACIIEVVKATNEHDRAERDLVAQQSMQLWALLLLGVSAAGTLIAGYGLILLRRTWTEAKSATKAAQDAVIVTRETGEAQIRAYPSFLHRSFSVRNPSRKEGVDDLHIQFSGDIVNNGASPATSVTLLYDISLIDSSFEVTADGVFFTDCGRTASNLSPGGEFDQSGHRTFGDGFTDVFQKRKRIRLAYAIRYTDVFNKTLVTPSMVGTLERDPNSGNYTFHLANTSI